MRGSGKDEGEPRRGTETRTRRKVKSEEETFAALIVIDYLRQLKGWTERNTKRKGVRRRNKKRKGRRRRRGRRRGRKGHRGGEGMLAQSVTASLYLQTRAKRVERRTRHNNNNTHFNNNDSNNNNNNNNKKDNPCSKEIKNKRRIEISSSHKVFQVGRCGGGLVGGGGGGLGRGGSGGRSRGGRGGGCGGCRLQSSFQSGREVDPASSKTSAEYKLSKREEEEEEEEGGKKESKEDKKGRVVGGERRGELGEGKGEAGIRGREGKVREERGVVEERKGETGVGKEERETGTKGRGENALAGEEEEEERRGGESGGGREGGGDKRGGSLLSGILGLGSLLGAEQTCWNPKDSPTQAHPDTHQHHHHLEPRTGSSVPREASNPLHIPSSLPDIPSSSPVISSSPLHIPSSSPDIPSSPFNEDSRLLNTSSRDALDKPSSSPVYIPPIPLNKSSLPLCIPSSPLIKPSSLINNPSSPLDNPSSPVIEHSSPLIKHSTPLIKHSSPLDIPSSPLDNPSSPLGNPSSPLIDSSSPLDKHSSPLIKHSNPGIDIHPKPSEESYQSKGLSSTSFLWSQLGSKVSKWKPYHRKNLEDRTLEWASRSGNCWRRKIPDFLPLVGDTTTKGLLGSLKESSIEWLVENWKRSELHHLKDTTWDLVEALRESGVWLESEWRRRRRGEGPTTDPMDMPLRVPIGDWLGLRIVIKDGLEMIKPLAPAPLNGAKRPCVPAVVVYDTGLCTREEDDPAQAVLFFRPCHTPTHARVSLAGQLAGVIHFCRHAFATPTAVRTRNAHVALKDYGRFVLMVCGRGGTWACGRLGEVTRLLDSATGGLQHLWHTCAHDHAAFTRRLTEVLDAILPVAIPDADLSVGSGGDGGGGEGGAVGSPSPSTATPSTASPATEASEVGGVLGESGKRGEEEEEESLRRLHRIFNTAPSLQLPKSGGAVFLRAQQVVEACQQQRGVLAGATMHKHRVLNTQMPSELTNVLAAVSLSSEKAGAVLQERRVEYALPSGVRLSTLHLPSRSHASLLKFQPKCGTRRSERCGPHTAEETSLGLSSFRSVLQSQQSLNAYPSSLPITIPDPKAPQDHLTCPHQPPSLPSSQPPQGHNLLAKISGGIASELRPTQSLPGSPRKIRVAATHPDVGGNSPDLRYKVLTGRKPRPPSSTNSSPRRLPGGRTGMARTNDSSSARRAAGLCPPSLTRGERRTTPTTDNRLITKLGYDSEKSESGYEDGVLSDSEVSLKNTKNRLNLHLAPDKINAPNTHIPLDSSDPSDEPKITREINGNHKESGEEDAEADGEEVGVNGNQREESDRSEDSDISVLDLAKFIDTKENGDRQLAEAVRGLVELTTRSDEAAEEEFTVSDDQPNLNHIEEKGVCESQGCEAVAVYRQQHQNTSLLLLLAPAAAASPQVVYTLWRLGVSGLTEVQQAVERALEVAESGEGGDSFLQWSPAALMASSPAALNTHLIDTAHQDFRKHRGIMEVTLRSDEAVMWGHRHSRTETFYQVNAQPRPGLPIPSDVMAKVPHRARRRLDRDHNITLL